MACLYATVVCIWYSDVLHRTGGQLVLCGNSENSIIAGSLESANSSILAARRLFKDFGGEKIRILC